MITKQLNSKSNIRQTSNADYPVTPRQPVMARGSQESTLGQTVITLPFSIDTVNAPDSLLISVDGKTLSRGSAYDYTYTAVDMYGFSNQVTLTQTIPSAGLNIECIKLGLKKENEFGQDARFNDLYESIDQGSQGFIRTSDLMVATATVGTPALGTFYSTISNRASIPDFRSDLKVSMGIERLSIQQIYQIQSEFGPNGENVFGTVNDPSNRVRFVGNWTFPIVSDGASALSASSGDYVEITFYGTGLNLLSLYNSTRDYRVSVNGAAEGANIIPASISNIINARNYPANEIINVVTGLTLGVHTVKIRSNSATVGLTVYGFEIVNAASNLTVNPGTSYIAGKKVSTLVQQTPAYNSSFETGTLGTRGGRVLVYQKADGTIAKSVTPTNAASATLSFADHTNEEVAKNIHWREFGAGRTDDFSIYSSASATNLAFTLDDGTTTLVGNQVSQSTVASTTNTLQLNTNSTSFATITFVGTGLDVIWAGDATGTNSNANSFTFAIDNGTPVNMPTAATIGIFSTLKCVSGLPYGTHTIKFFRNTPNVWTLCLKQFIVYQPKKPTVPSGVVELADYNIMASYVANAIAGIDNIGTGVLQKMQGKEMIYTGTWSAAISTGNVIGGLNITSTTVSDTQRYVFFGTGFELRPQGAAANTFTISVDGSTNLSSFTTSAYGTGIALTASTGTVVQSVATAGGGISVSGLSLGIHTVICTKTVGVSGLGINAFDIITPIHSYKSNLNYDQQNTLSVGSQAISDNRKVSPVKDVAISAKNVSQVAAAAVSGPSTTSTVPVPMPEMSVTHFNKSGKIKISYSGNFQNSGANTSRVYMYVDGSVVGSNRTILGYVVASDSIVVNASPGYHKIDLYWSTDNSGVPLTALTTFRSLLVEEI